MKKLVSVQDYQVQAFVLAQDFPKVPREFSPKSRDAFLKK